MNTQNNESYQEIRDAIKSLCKPFDDAYWRQKDEEKTFPEDFYRAVADGGWLGVAVPEPYGGAGLGMGGALAVLQTIAESGAGMNGGTAVKINIFGLSSIIRHGSEEQKQRMIPDVIGGRKKVCFAITEPDVGLNTTHLKTVARREGDHYVINGAKTWISTAQQADYVLILARTTPLEEVSKPSQGLSLFLTPMDRDYVEVREIDRMGRCAVDANQVFIDGLRVPVSDRIGAEGDGLKVVFDSMNPERMVVAAEAVGIGRAALRKATRYANERVVFGRLIGQNQGVQHPLAKCWMELEAANLMAQKAAALFDQGEPCGLESNAAKYLASEAGHNACQTAILTLGGNGFAREFDVERYLRDIYVARLAPISEQLIFSYIAERALDLPKSY